MTHRFRSEGPLPGSRDEVSGTVSSDGKTQLIADLGKVRSLAAARWIPPTGRPAILSVQRAWDDVAATGGGDDGLGRALPSR